MSFALRITLLIAVSSGSVGCSIFWSVPASPLADAAWRGDVAAIRQLVDSGAAIDAIDDMGATPLYWAARGGHRLGPHHCKGEDSLRPQVIQTLLELGANPNIQDRRPKGMGRSSGWTPLFVALHHEQYNSARILLEHGADPNILSDQGVSVMAVASTEGAPKELIALLVQKGFDPQNTHRRAD